jgi:HPt (histidine-containing phosphotransfer) domain-containing protein
LVDMTAFANLKRLGGPAFVSSLVSQFSSDAAELLSLLRMAVADEDVKRFRDTVHALRASAANLGASKIFNGCLALRDITPSQLTREGDARIGQLVDDIDATIEMLKAHLAVYRDESRPASRVGIGSQ